MNFMLKQTRNVLLFYSCLAVQVGFAQSNPTIPEPTQKPPRFFATIEGDYVLPDEDQVIQSLQNSTKISNQRTKNNFNYAAGIGTFINNGMFIVAKYRRLTPSDLFTTNQSDDISDWKEKWNFSFFDLDLGKDTELNSNVGIHAYIGIGLMSAKVTAFEKKVNPDATQPINQSQKLEIFGYGPKIGVDSHYNFNHWFGLLGGAETSFYFSHLKRFSSTEGSAYTPDWSNYHTTLPMIGAFLATNFTPTRNFEFQIGMRAFHSFNFDTNAFLSIYQDVFLANDIGWYGPYASATLRF